MDGNEIITLASCIIFVAVLLFYLFYKFVIKKRKISKENNLNSNDLNYARDDNFYVLETLKNQENRILQLKDDFLKDVDHINEAKSETKYNQLIENIINFYNIDLVLLELYFENKYNQKIISLEKRIVNALLFLKKYHNPNKNNEIKVCQFVSENKTYHLIYLKTNIENKNDYFLIFIDKNKELIDKVLEFLNKFITMQKTITIDLQTISILAFNFINQLDKSFIYKTKFEKQTNSRKKSNQKINHNLLTRDSKNYYEILGVEKTATLAEIKKAYRTKAKQLHPDMNKNKNADKEFKKINEAYEVLSNEQKRKNYDLLN